KFENNTAEVVAAPSVHAYEYDVLEPARHAITSNGTAVYLGSIADGGSPTSILKFAPGAVAPTEFAASVDDYTPQLLIGATDDHVLYHAFDSNTNKSSVVLMQGMEPTVLREYDGLGAGSLFSAGMLSTNGKGAFLETNGVGANTTLWY